MKRIVSLLLVFALMLPLAACGGKKNATNTELLQMAENGTFDEGALTEETDYSLLRFDGITWEAATDHRNNLFAGLNGANMGFHHNENKTLNNATVTHFDESVVSEDLRDNPVYVHAVFYSETLLLFVGENVPDERNRWLMAGTPEAELDPEKVPVFDGDDLSPFVPVCDSIDMSAKDHNGHTEDQTFYHFLLSDITMEQVNDYVQAALNMGYAETERGDMGNADHNTFYFEGQLPNRVSICLHYYDGVLMTDICPPNYVASHEDSWRELYYYVNGAPSDEPSFNSQLIYGGLWTDICWNEMVKLYIGDQIGTGTGTHSSGYVFWEHNMANQQIFDDCFAKARTNGFVEGAEQTDNRYTAWKHVDYEGNTVTLWVTLQLQGDYFYCAVGLAKVEGDRAPQP